MRLWDELVCEIFKVSVFVGRVFFNLIRNVDLPCHPPLIFLPYMAYTGMCRWTGYGSWPLCPKQCTVEPPWATTSCKRPRPLFGPESLMIFHCYVFNLLQATTWRILWSLCLLSCVHYATKNIRRTLVTLWNYTWRSLDIACNLINFHKVDVSGPLRGRDPCGSILVSDRLP